MAWNDCRGRCEECRNEDLGAGAGGVGLNHAPRRTMLSWLLGGGALASMASFLYPVVRFLNPPLITEAAINEVAAGKVQDLKPNSGKIIKFGNKPALLVRVSETEWKAFLGCMHAFKLYRPISGFHQADLVRLP